MYGVQDTLSNFVTVYETLRSGRQQKKKKNWIRHLWEERYSYCEVIWKHESTARRSSIVLSRTAFSLL